MATKKYIAHSQVSLSVLLSNGKSTRVCFTPLTGSGSYFYTGDEELQEALEKHPRFNRLFSIDKHFNPTPVHEEKAMDVKVEKKMLEVQVSCLDDAKDYLSDKYGVSRTKMRTSKAIEEIAASHNIVFVGL